MTEQSHQSDPAILNRRTVKDDHPHLLDILQAGMTVLDVGCGTGAVTAGIADRVGPQGRVIEWIVTNRSWRLPEKSTVIREA